MTEKSKRRERLKMLGDIVRGGTKPPVAGSANGSAKYTLEWQMPNGKWDRWSSRLDSPEDVIARAKFFFRDWLEMPAMRIIKISPNVEVSEVAVADATKTCGVRRHFRWPDWFGRPDYENRKS